MHATLLGRLDPAAKNVAQVGAAIGCDFSYELPAAVVPLAAVSSKAGRVFQRGAPPAAEYLLSVARPEP